MLINDIEEMCPYWDICATTQFHMREKYTFIAVVCSGKQHKLCTHFIGLDVRSKDEIERIREAMRDKYGEPKYSLR